MHEGDIVSTPYQEQFLVIKILRVSPDGNTYHCLMYKPVHEPPRIDDIQALEVLAWHGPIDASSIDQHGTFIGNIAVAPNELAGYIEHLKHTDFQRYLKETQQDFDTVFNAAKEHYKRGCALTDPNQAHEAVAEYTAAVDIYPFHFYALDNRGLTYMELGDLHAAIQDFRRSLEIKPDNVLPLFSLGECHFKLGDLSAALEYFEKAQKVAPENATVLNWIAKTKAAIAKKN